MNLNRNDILLIITGLVVSSIAAWWGTTISPEQVLQFEWWSAIPLIPFFFATLYVVFRFQEVWGGTMARDLGIMGIATLATLLNLVFHVRWHVDGLGFENLQPWGISVDFWLVFFHLTAVANLLLMAYGAYNLQSE